MSNVVRSAAVRLTMENAGYIRGGDQAAAATERTTGRIQRAVRRTAVATGRDWDTMGKYGGRTALAIGAGLAFAEKRIISFDKTMSAAQAATSANTRELEQLRAAAIKAGADTAFTSTEAAQAITEEGKAGISTANILRGGLRGALDLAAAGTIGVGEAAEYTATALVQFHLSGDQARHVADLLAASASKAQGEVTDMSLALSYVGVPAHAARISLEQTVGTIALLAKNGLIGEKAGTSLRGMLASLQAPSTIASKVMKKYGIDVFDASGRLKGFNGIAQELHDHLGKLTDEERQYALGKIFGNEQLQAANILLEAGARGVNKMTREVNDQGYATEVANKKLDNLAGDWERFTGSLEAAFIKAGTPVQDTLRDIVQDAESLVNHFAELPDEVQAGIVKVTILAGTIGGVLYAISKIRNVARDLRGIRPGRAGAGGLGGVASLAAPVPVFVVNMGAGGLIGGGKGGTTILGGGGAAGETKLFGKAFKIPRGTGIVATLGGLALMATGTTSKTHSGSTVGGALAGGSILGIPGALFGGSIGTLKDVYNAGNSTADAIKRAQDALDSGDFKAQKQALEDLQKVTEKLGYGGWEQNFNRAITVLTGRDDDLKSTTAALQSALDEHKYNGNMLWLVSGGRMGKAPRVHAPDPKSVALEGQAAIANLLDPNRKGVGAKRAKPKTSKDVLADFFGVDVDKLKPVKPNVLDKLLGNDTDKLPHPGKKHLTPGINVLEASLGMDTTDFDAKDKQARRRLKELGALAVVPKVMLTGVPEALSAAAALKRLLESLHDRNIHINVTKTTNATLAEAAANNRGGGRDGDPNTPWAGGGYTGAGGKYEAAGIVHRREFVFSAEATRGNEAFLDGLHRRLRGYADGGLVGAGTIATYSRTTETDRVSGSLKHLREELDRAKKSLERERRTRDDLASKRAELVSGVTSSLTSELFKQQGAFSGTAGIVSGALGTLRTDVARARRFTQLEKQLAGRGLKGEALATLEREANGDPNILAAFAAASSRDLRSFQTLITQRAHDTAAAGAQAGAAYTREQRATTHEIRMLRNEIKRLEDAIDRSADRIGDKLNGAAAAGHRRRGH